MPGPAFNINETEARGGGGGPYTRVLQLVNVTIATSMAAAQKRDFFIQLSFLYDGFQLLKVIYGLLKPVIFI